MEDYTIKQEKVKYIFNLCKIIFKINIYLLINIS